MNYSSKSSTPAGHSPDQLISDDVRHYFEIAFFVSINGILSVLGSVANVINVIVYLRQHLTSPLLERSFISSWQITVPHGLCVRIAWWITTFITFERCLSIALPLQIKQIMTPALTACVMAGITLVIAAGMTPLFASYTLSSKYFSSRNRTLTGLVYVPTGPYLEQVGSYFNVVTEFSSVILDIIFTLIIVRTLQTNSKWRRGMVGSDKEPAGLRGRDKKVIKMVVLISCIFIACTLPSCVNFIVGVVVADVYNLVGAQRNSYYVIWSVILTLEAVNSSVNIFVYYVMSQRYRETFNQLFGRRVN
ncbi:uncharacterized protein LOC131937834 [Physella acuta]|uniref:uncharacterized protein LOC131937834 n=1 Tax=Physella acuta TaxID=109671 RepID=UPI0027DC3513|nr:uncharacterized protein LOC131937834 [Physella acuta]